jgi:hypothetical protein
MTEFERIEKNINREVPEGNVLQFIATVDDANQYIYIPNKRSR